MSQLKDYLEEIKQEKEQLLIPANINKGVTILGVPGNSLYTIKADSSIPTSVQSSFMYFITEIKDIDFSKFTGTSLTYFFSGFSNLKKVKLTIPNTITGFRDFFSGCSALEEVDLTDVDLSNANNLSNMFSNCLALTNDSLNSILEACSKASNYPTKTLAHIGLTSAQATICTGLSNYADFVAAGWSTGY